MESVSFHHVQGSNHLIISQTPELVAGGAKAEASLLYKGVKPL
jgi:hypothetical protein